MRVLRRRTRLPDLGLRMLEVLLLALGGGACASITEVEAPALEEVLLRDGRPFESGRLPGALVDRLADHRLVIIGETHFIRDHRELVADVLQSLHARGFRQLLWEWPQAADVLVADFVHDGGLVPDWDPPRILGGDLLLAIREFNRSLPSEQQIRVRGIDVNLDDYGGAGMFMDQLRLVAIPLDPPGPLTAFLSGGERAPRRHARALEALSEALEDQATQLAGSWGRDRFEQVSEMVAIERASATVRSLREDRYEMSVKLRENVMKQLVDRRLERDPSGAVLNVGSSHAQKSVLRGTDQEWLGDYLVHRSRATGGSVFVLDVSPVLIVPERENGTVYFDVAESSPENELFRSLSRTWPSLSVFLPLDDPLFRRGGIAMNFEEVIWVCAPKEQYDGVVVLPVGHRVEG